MILLLAGVAEAQDATKSPIRKRTTAEDLQMFGQVLNQIRVNHPDSLDTHELLMAAIEGMAGAADPHSYVVPAMRLDPKKELEMRAGKLYPVPVNFYFVGGSPVVSSVPAGTAARALDILPGDELIAVDGKSVAARSAQELDISMSGPKGQAVSLEFERQRQDGSLARITRSVKRERPGEETAVPSAFMLDAATGYVRITTFVGEKVADHVHGALEKLEKSGMRQLLLDLRDNGGGSVAEAAHAAGEFLPSGDIVYTSTGSKKEVTDTGRVKRSFWRRERRYPIVVMINSGTASASELVAGALQDHDRALIVGRPSFGKSLLMQGFPLADGSYIMLVIGKVRTPCGRVVQRDYRSVTSREYYRLAAADRDTVGRPTCKTDAGRTVYGGGGVYPDVSSPAGAKYPAWLSRIGEELVSVRWGGSYITAHPDDFASMDAFLSLSTPRTSMLTDFREFAVTQGSVVPRDAEADVLLERMLIQTLAQIKWGEAGFYKAVALFDPEIRAASARFAEAAALISKEQR